MPPSCTSTRVLACQALRANYACSAANDFWGKTYLKLTGQKKMTQELSILTGSSAGATESFVVVPFELVKIKLQDKNSTFAGPMDVVRTIIKKDGLLGLFLQRPRS